MEILNIIQNFSQALLVALRAIIGIILIVADYDTLYENCDEIARMLSGLITR